MANKDSNFNPQLKRSISLFQATMYGTGIILGAGIYVLIGDVAGIAGNAMWISFMVAACIAALTGISYAELSSMFPRSAAEYVFVRNAFHKNLLAFVAGWLIIFVAVIAAAAVAIGFSGYLGKFILQADPMISAILLVGAVSIVNFIGIRESAWTNTIFTLVEVAGLAIIIAAGLYMGFPDVNYYEMPPDITSPQLAAGAILGATGLIFFAYFGFENLANIAEETKNARRTIPLALMISILVTTVIYVLVALAAIALVGWDALSSSDAPLATAAEKAFGNAGVVMLSVIALFATTNTVLMLLVSGSRIMFGMAEEGALPGRLAAIHHVTKTPTAAVVITMALAVTAIALSFGRIDVVANAAVSGIFIVYAFVNASLIWLRYKNPELDRPFRSPASIGRFPVLAGLGLVTSIAMLTQFDWLTIAICIATIGSAVVAFTMGRSFPLRKTDGKP